MKYALAFGLGRGARFLRGPCVRDHEAAASIGLMDAGLSRARVPDCYGDRVAWACAGEPLWFSFVWNTLFDDGRRQYKAGFIVCGFGMDEHEAAFDFACKAHPEVIAACNRPLILMEYRREPRILRAA